MGSTLLVNGPFRRLPLTHVESCAECVALSVGCDAAKGETLNVIDSDDVRAWRYAGELVRNGVANVRRRIALPYALGLAVAMLASAVARLLLGPDLGCRNPDAGAISRALPLAAIPEPEGGPRVGLEAGRSRRARAPHELRAS
jgi:hypothetical protein